MERLALFLAAEPLQALTPGFLLSVAPELDAAGHAPALPAMAASAASAPSLPPLLQPTLPAQENAAAVLARFQGQRDAAARHLGISRTTLWRRLKAGD